MSNVDRAGRQFAVTEATSTGMETATARWIPASAGMTTVGGSKWVNSPVIPAQAGIQAASKATHRKGSNPMSSARSRQSGFAASISANFHARFHFLIRFSRRMACSIVPCGKPGALTCALTQLMLGKRREPGVRVL